MADITYRRINLEEANDLLGVSIPAPYFWIASIGSPVEIRLAANSTEAESLAASDKGRAYTTRDGSNFGEIYVSNDEGTGELVIALSDSVCADFPSGGASAGESPSLTIPIFQPVIRRVYTDDFANARVLEVVNIGSGQLGDTNSDNFMTNDVGGPNGGAGNYAVVLDEGGVLGVGGNGGGVTGTTETSYLRASPSQGWAPAELWKSLRYNEVAQANFGAQFRYEFELCDEMKASFPDVLNNASVARVMYGISNNIPTPGSNNGIRVGFIATPGDDFWRLAIQGSDGGALDYNISLSARWDEWNRLALRWGRNADGEAFVGAYVNGELDASLDIPGTDGDYGEDSAYYLGYFVHYDVADANKLYAWGTMGPKLSYREYR